MLLCCVIAQVTDRSVEHVLRALLVSETQPSLNP